MMTDISTISKGLAQYVDSEIITQMPIELKGKKFAVATASTVLIKQLDRIVENAENIWILKALGLIEDGKINLDVIKDTVLDKMPSEGLDVGELCFGGVQLLPKMTFNKDDVNKLYKCIQSYSTVAVESNQVVVNQPFKT